MLSMNEVNAMLKSNFQAQLQEIPSLPEDLARGYKDWVHGLISQAQAKIKNEMQPNAQMQEQPTQSQPMQAPPAQQ